MKYFVALLLPFLLLHSCRSTDNNSDNAKFQQDSVAIINYFLESARHPDSFQSYHAKAKQLYDENQNLAVGYWYNLAEYFINVQEFDSAQVYIDKGIEIVNDSNSFESAQFYNLLGIKAMYSDKLDDAIYYYNLSTKIFEAAGQSVPAAVMYVNLSDIFSIRGDYKNAFEYAYKGYAILDDNQDYFYLPASLSQVANLYLFYKEDIENATMFASRAEYLADSLHDYTAQTTAALAWGGIYSFQKDYNKAEKAYLKALDLCEKYNQVEHISKAYTNLGFVYIEAKQYDKAISILKDVEKAVAEDHSMLYDVHLSLSNAYEHKKQYDSAFTYLKKAELEFRTISNEKSQKHAQELLISYEDQKKNEQLAVQAKTISIALGVLVLLGFVTFTLFVIIFVKGRLRKVKERLLTERHQQEVLISMAQGEEKERMRIASELHNGVAAQLTGIKFNLESLANENLGLEEIVGQVVKTHKEVRSIAHNLQPIDFNEVTLFGAVEDFINDINITTQKVHLYISDGAIELESTKAKIIYRYVQEFVQNAIKYSDSESIFVNIMHLQDEGKWQISIEDEGIGFDVLTFERKNNFSHNNILKQLDIDIHVNSTLGEGTIVLIKF